MFTDQDKLTKLTGKLDRISAGIGNIQVTRPELLFGRDAKFRLSSKVSVSEAQISHSVEFYGAFTYEQLTAYYDIVADINSHEKLTEMFGAVVREESMSTFSTMATQVIVTSPSIKTANPFVPTRATSVDTTTAKTMSYVSTVTPFVSKRVQFYPERIGIGWKGNEEHRYLNGTVMVNGKKFKAGFDVNDLGSLKGCSEKPIDCANEILSRIKKGGFSVYCKPRNNKYYSVLIGKSFCSVEELMADSTDSPEPQPEFSKSKSVRNIETKAEINSKFDNSFLKGKTVDFVCERKDGKRIAGKFKYAGQEYKGRLNCSLKESKMLLGTTVKAVVVIANEAVILKRV